MRPIHRDALERWIEIPAPEKLDESHPPGALDLPVGQQDFGAAIQWPIGGSARAVCDARIGAHRMLSEAEGERR